MTQKWYRLPGGKRTRSADVYGRRWRSLASQVSKRLPGLRLYFVAADPGLLLGRKGGGPSVSLTAELAQAIADIPRG